MEEGEDEEKSQKKKWAANILAQTRYEDMAGVMVDYINTHHFTWTAEMNDNYNGLTLT